MCGGEAVGCMHERTACGRAMGVIYENREGVPAMHEGICVMRGANNCVNNFYTEKKDNCTLGNRYLISPNMLKAFTPPGQRLDGSFMAMHQ